MKKAMEHFQRGVAAVESKPMDSVSADREYGLGRALAPLGKLLEATAHLQSAFKYFESIKDAGRAVAVASNFFFAGRSSRSDILLEQALQMAEPDSVGAGRILSHIAGRKAYKNELTSAEQFFKKALHIATARKDPALEMCVLSSWADMEGRRDNEQGNYEKCLRVIELARIADDPLSVFRARASILQRFRRQGKFDDAEAHVKANSEIAERLHDRLFMVLASNENQQISLCRGDWRRARELGDRALALQVDAFGFFSYMMYGNRAYLEYETGNESEGSEILDRFFRLAQRIIAEDPDDSQMRGAIMSYVPHIARISGDYQWLDFAETAGKKVLSMPESHPNIARLARQGLGLIAVLRDDKKAAPEYYECLISDRVLIKPGIDHRQLLGMPPLQSRIEKRLGRLQAPIGEKPSYLDELTQREVEVLKLIAEGLTNQKIGDGLFISIRTVGTHVAHIFDKTGCANRAEAGVYAIRNGLAEG